MERQRGQARNRKTWLLILMMTVFAMVLSACGGGKNNSEPAASSSDAGSPSPSAPASASASAEPSASPSAAPVKVKLQLKWVPQAQFAGYFVALDKGYYKDEGLDVELVPGGPDIVPEQQVANFAADIGIDWVASLLASQEAGMPIVEIAQIYQSSGLQLISKKSAGINGPADLKGKKVGNWMGGNEYELLALFDKYGIDPNKDISFTKQGFTMDQFLAGELDAASVMTYNEYHMTLEAGVKAEDLNVIDMNAEGVAMLEDNLFANKDWLAKNKDTAAKFVRASLKGWKDAVADPEGATDIVMKSVEDGSTTREHQLTMMQEVAKLVAPEGYDQSKLGFIDDAAFKRTADIALQFSVIKNPADLTAAYTNEIVQMATQ